LHKVAELMRQRKRQICWANHSRWVNL
jgi:hypothetical protein